MAGGFGIPRGDKLVFQNNTYPNQAMLYNPSNGTVSQITSGDDIDRVVWDPTGTWLAFDAGGGDNAVAHLFKIKIDGTGLQQIGTLLGHRPSW